MRDRMDRGARVVPLRNAFGAIVAFVPSGDELVGDRAPFDPGADRADLDLVLRDVARIMDRPS